MQAIITPRKLKGEINITPSKSYLHRVIIAASLAMGTSIIENIALSEDIQATIDICVSFGSSIIKDDNKLIITGSKIKRLSKNINAKESGSTLRFLLPILLLNNEEITIDGKTSLTSRPLEPYFDIFNSMNIKYNSKVLPITFGGTLKGGNIIIDGSISSQFITGLLFALPLLNNDSRIIIKNELVSKSYVDITIDVLDKFGIDIINNNYQEFIIKGNQEYKSINYCVEGDYSQAAFFMVLNEFGSHITIKGLNENSLQADKKIIEYIDYLNKDLNEAIIDIDQTPDLGPVIAVLLATKPYNSKIVNCKRLRIKESDRITSIVNELKKMNVKISECDDEIHVNGFNDIKCLETLDSHNDHRIVMGLTVLSTISKNEVIINGVEAINKSYPNFFKDYQMLGGVIHEKY